MHDDRNDGKFWFGFFLGGLIGALVIFFLGTKEGKRVGKLLEKKGQDVIEDLEEKVEELEQKGKELARQGEVIKDKVIEHLEEKKEEITETAVEKIDSALAQIEAIQEKGAQATANLRTRFKNLPKKT